MTEVWFDRVAVEQGSAFCNHCNFSFCVKDNLHLKKLKLLVLIFSTTILYRVSLLFCTFIGFLQFRHRTRFRDSFCLASMFKCLFTYLLTYLLAVTIIASISQRALPINFTGDLFALKIDKCPGVIELCWNLCHLLRIYLNLFLFIIYYIDLNSHVPDR